MGIVRQVVFEALTLRFSHLTVRHDKDVAAGGEDRLTPVSLLFRARHKAAAVVQRYAKMQAQRILYVKIDRQHFAAGTRQTPGQVGRHGGFSYSPFWRAHTN